METATKSETKLQIIEGRYYKNRKGEKIGPMKFCQPSDKWPFCAYVPSEQMELSFRSDGAWIRRDRIEDNDLVCEWPADPAPEAEQPAATATGEVDDTQTRPLGDSEVLEANDLFDFGNDPKLFRDLTIHDSAGQTVAANKAAWSGRKNYRRRIPTPAPQDETLVEQFRREHPMQWASAVETANRELTEEVSELRKANAELLEQNAKLEDELSLVVMQRSNAIDAIKESIIERDQLQKVIDGYNVERDKLLAERNAAQAERDRLNGLLNNERNAYTFLQAQLAAVTKERDKLFNRYQDESGIVCRWREATGCPDPTTYKARTQQPPAAGVEQWRELSKGEQYSGPGQVRNNESDDWRDAHIAATDNPGHYSFLARPTNDLYNCFCFARVRV